MEQRRALLSTCSTFWGAVPHFWDEVPQIVELFHFLWDCSTKSGTVPLCVGLLGYCPSANRAQQSLTGTCVVRSQSCNVVQQSQQANVEN